MIGRAIRHIGLLIAVLCAAPARAQEVGGALEGRVIDTQGQPLPGARVTVTGPAILGGRGAFVDAAGWFRVAPLPVGACTLRVDLLGHLPWRTAVTVELGATRALGDIRLTDNAIPIAGTEVRSRPDTFDPRSTRIGGTIEVQAARALPVDRDYQSLVTLLPHANESSFGDRANLMGTTGAESRYYVDGMDVGEPPGNGLSASLPYNFLRAIEVRAGGYEAEFGGAGGGIVNAVTAAGGNAFHGQVFGFRATRLLTSGAGSLAVNSRTSSFGAWDAGVTVGGPLRRDRLWFLAAYNPAFERETVEIPGLGAFDDRRTAQRFAGKLTWRPAAATTIALSAIGDPSTRYQVGGVILSKASTLSVADPILGDDRGGGTHGALRITQLLGTSAYAEAQVGHSATRYSRLPQTAAGAANPLYLDTRTGVVEGGFGQNIDRDASRTSVRGSMAWAGRAHAAKTGFAWEDEFAREWFTLDQIFRLADSLYQYVTLADRRTSNHVRSLALFVQDAWHVTPHVTVSAGLRQSMEWWASSNGTTRQRIRDGWQPRLGVTWRPGLRRPLKLFGAGGRFQQQTRLNVPQFFLQDVSSTYLVRLFNHDPRQDPTGGVPVFAQTLGLQPEVGGLRPAAFDEYQAGAEWQPGAGYRIGLRGVHRAQREAIVGVLSPLSGAVVYGNPGRGELAAFPEIDRVYRALELTMERETEAGTLRVGVVFSRNRGNYEGYWDQTASQNDQLGGASFMALPAQAPNTLGSLPNDRPWQVKLQASRRLPQRLECGLTFAAAAGTPLSRLGSTPFGAPYYVFLTPRGSEGRTPTVMDLNLRAAWDVPAGGTLKPRLIVDAFHIGNPRRALVYDQVAFRGLDALGNQVGPNPNYGRPLLLQPPVAYRMGLELNW